MSYLSPPRPKVDRQESERRPRLLVIVGVVIRRGGGGCRWVKMRKKSRLVIRNKSIT